MTKKKCLYMLLFVSFLLFTVLVQGCKSTPDSMSDIPQTPHKSLEDINNANKTRKPQDTRTAANTGSDSSNPGTAQNILGTVMLPENSYTFWNKVMTYSAISKYKAQGYRTFCNLFLGDTLRMYFGDTVFSRIFPNGVLDPNVIHMEWQSNPNLIRLGPDEYSILDIQNMANEGYLIVMSYIWTWGHLAFVGNHNLQINTVPASPMINGIKGTDLDDSWLPVMVQAGTYTGVTSMGYASNGWIDAPNYPLFRDGTVRYYLVKQ